MMNRREEFNVEMMEQVNGGLFDPLIHKHCGGTILNVFNPFRYCVCDKCGEEHFSFGSFDLVYDDDIEFQ